MAATTPRPKTLPTPTNSSNSSLTIEQRIRKPSATLVKIIATIFGRGGVGKTTLLRTLPGAGLVIDIPVIEGGTCVLSEGEESERLRIFQAVRWEDFDEIYRWLKEGKHEFKWVAIDSLTAAQKLAKRKIVRERALGSDPHQVSQQEWGKIGSLMEELFYRFHQLPMHVIFIAQEKLKGVEDGGQEFQPDISPMALGALNPSMFLVGRLFVREVDDPDNPGTLKEERRLRVGVHSGTLTKIRTLPSRPVPGIIRDPNLGNIFGYMLGMKVPPPEGVAEEASFLFSEVTITEQQQQPTTEQPEGEAWPTQ